MSIEFVSSFGMRGVVRIYEKDHPANLLYENHNVIVDTVRSLFARLMDMLVRENHRMNLTAVRNPADIAIAHFADSLAAVDAAPELAHAARGADVGSGPGFPVLPLAILFPQTQWIANNKVARNIAMVAL